MQTPEPYFPSNSLNLNAMFYRTSTKKQKRKIKTVQFTHLLLSIHKKKRKKRNENGIKRKKTLANTLLWQAKPSAGTRRFRRSGKRRGCSVERRRATDNVARLVCEARAVASFEPPLSYFRAARATMPATTSPRQPTYLSSMHRSPPPPPRPRARSRSPRALHRNTGSIFFPRSCTEHDQPHRCAPPTLVDSARERIYFSSTTTRPRRG